MDAEVTDAQPTAAQAMPSPTDTRAQIQEVAEGLRKIAGLLAQGTQLGRWDGSGTPGWVGEAADAYMSSISLLRTKLTPLVNGLMVAVKEAEDWEQALVDVIDRKIPELHDTWNQIQRTVDREQSQAQQVEDSPDGVRVPSAPGRSGELDHWAHARRMEVLEDYQKVISALNEAAQVAASAVKVARTLFLPEDIGNSREEIGEHMFEDENSILEAQNKWEQGEKTAQEIAERFEGGFVDEKEVQEFLDEYGDDLEDPIVATALGKLVSPEQLTNGTLQNLGVIYDQDVHDEFVNKMGTFVVLASGGANWSPEQAENQELFLQFEEAMPETRVGNEVYSGRSETPSQTRFVCSLNKPQCLRPRGFCAEVA